MMGIRTICSERSNVIAIPVSGEPIVMATLVNENAAQQLVPLIAHYLRGTDVSFKLNGKQFYLRFVRKINL